MSILRKNRLFFSLALPLALGALLLGSFFDLPLSRAVYRERAPLGVILEAVCFLPLYAPLALAALAGAAQAGRKSVRALLLLLGCAVLFGMTYSVFHYLGKRGIHSAAAVQIAACLLCALGGALPAFFALRRATADTRRALLRLSLLGILYLVWELALVQSLKAIAGRPRFEDLLAGRGAFAPWYAFSRQGGSSFPSGHTAAACGVWLLLLLPEFFPRLQKRRTAYGIASTLYVCLAGFSRIVVGKHFLSDVAAGMLLMLLGFALLCLVAQRLLPREGSTKTA